MTPKYIMSLSFRSRVQEQCMSLHCYAATTVTLLTLIYMHFNCFVDQD